MTDYSDRIEKWTSYMMIGDRKLYFSGRRIQAGGKEYAVIMDKHGRISRGIDLACVETFGNRSQPAKALEQAFHEALEGGDIMAEIMEREIAS